MFNKCQNQFPDEQVAQNRLPCGSRVGSRQMSLCQTLRGSWDSESECQRMTFKKTDVLCGFPENVVAREKTFILAGSLERGACGPFLRGDGELMSAIVSGEAPEGVPLNGMQLPGEYVLLDLGMSQSRQLLLGMICRESAKETNYSSGFPNFRGGGGGGGGTHFSRGTTDPLAADVAVVLQVPLLLLPGPQRATGSACLDPADFKGSKCSRAAACVCVCLLFVFSCFKERSRDPNLPPPSLAHSSTCHKTRGLGNCKVEGVLESPVRSSRFRAVFGCSLFP